MHKVCKQCGESFEIFPEDRALYDKVSPIFGGKKYLLPDPIYCPTCRFIRQASFRNERSMYRSKSSLSGKPLISIYSPDKGFTVYSYDEWWSEKWDAVEYGRDYDFSRPFFEQFAELFKAVPKLNLIQDGTSENCEYTNFGAESKNCYLSLVWRSEDIYYAWAVMSRDCVDCLYVIGCERLYQCVNCDQSYNCFYLQNCDQCRDSYFLEACTGCSNCLGCKNLRHKQYYVFNKPYSKEQYEEEFKKYHLNTYSGIESFKKEFEKFRLTLPFVYSVQKNCENSSGDFLSGAKNCHYCFKIALGAENCRYCNFVGLNAYDIIDSYNTDITLNCGSDGTLNSQKIRYSHYIRNCSEIDHSALCYNSSHLFGCTGLNWKKYCILNKQYSQSQYLELVPKIVEQMRKTGEWGQNFPPSISAFGYNESYSGDMFPMEKAQALRMGFKWSDYEQKVESEGAITELPETIDEVTDEILKKAIICEKTGKLFKIIEQELNFYRKMNLPLPRLHYDQRAFERYRQMNPYRLWKRKCDQCGKELESSFAQVRPEIVYCEACYLKVVY